MRNTTLICMFFLCILGVTAVDAATVADIVISGVPEDIPASVIAQWRKEFVMPSGAAFQDRFLITDSQFLGKRLQENGYSDVSTIPRVTADNNKVTITYLVTPGPLYTVSKMDFDKDIDQADAKVSRLIKLHGIAVGTAYNPTEAAKLCDDLTEVFGFNCRYSFKADSTTHVIALTFHREK